MKKIGLIAEGDLGENLYELLNFEGFQAQRFGYPKLPEKNSPLAPDLLICEADAVRFGNLWVPPTSLQQYPYLLLCEDGLVQQDLPIAMQYLQLPFSDDDFFSALHACLRVK